MLEAHPYANEFPMASEDDIAIARGGTNHMRNLKLCHRSCNQDKGAA